MLPTLRSIQWFRHVEDAALAMLSEHVIWHTLHEHDYLWHVGDDADSFTFIGHGMVEISKTNARGDDAMIAILGPGEGVGNVAVMEGTPYPARARVLSETATIARIPRTSMERAMEIYPSVLRASTQALLANTHALRAKIDILTAGDVSARVAKLLLHLADRFGDEQEDATVFIPVVLSRANIARLVGAREETIIRCLSAWRKAGVVETTPRGIVLRDPTELEALQEATDAD